MQNEQGEAPMTEQQATGTASSQLKDLVMQRLNQGLGLAAKTAGQQAGTVAQAVRQTGEEMRQQEQDGQGKMADRIAQPIQRLSGNLSQANPDVSSDVKGLKPKLSGQAQQLKAQAGSRVKAQAQTPTTAAAEGVTAATQGVRQVGEQLRAQGQQTPALVMDALAEKMEPVAGYLDTTDPDKLRSDVAAYRKKAQLKVTTAAETVNRKQQAAAAKATQAAKTTARRVRNQPALPIAGALSIVALAAFRMLKSKGQPKPVDLLDVQEVQDLQGQGLQDFAGPQFDAAVAAPGVSTDRLNLTRGQLRDEATAAGLEVGPEMTKRELIDALDSVTFADPPMPQI